MVIMGMGAVLLMGACATPPTVPVFFEPPEAPTFVFPPQRGLTLYLGPITGYDHTLWYKLGEEAWYLEKTPSLIVQEALAEELRCMGITPCERPSEGQGRLEVEIRWFAPYGYNCFSAAVILSLSLYPRDMTRPVWRGKLEGGAFSRPVIWTGNQKREAMGKVLSRALAKTVRQLPWKAGFLRAVSRLGKGTKEPVKMSPAG